MSRQRLTSSAFLKILLTAIAGSLIAVSFTSSSPQGQQGGGTVILGGPPGGGGNGGNGGSSGGSSSGGSSGGGGGTDNENGGAIAAVKVLRVEEVKSANSAYASGANITTSSTRHVTRLKLRMPYSQTTTSLSNGTLQRSTNWISVVGVESGAEIGAEGSLPSVTWVNTDAPQTTGTNLLAISQPTGQGEWTGFVQIGNSGALSSGHIKLWVRSNVGVEQLPPGQSQWQVTSNTSQWNYADLAVNKVPLTAVSLDSRRTYGQPNLDGEIPGDANADFRSPSFSGWNFKGGHFVGNMPAGNSDQSGLARTQLSTDSAGSSTGYIAGCCTLFATGTRGTTSGGTIGLFKPSASDTNLNQGLSAVWENRWDLNPRTAPGTPPDYTQDPFWTISSTTDNQNNYWNWQIPYNTTDESITPWARFGLTQTVESGQTWQYFSSVWNQGLAGQSFPITDSQPRLWVVRTN